MPAKTKTAETPAQTPAETPAEETNEETPAKGRAAEPFGRGFNLAIKFHNDLTDAQRAEIVSSILETLDSVTDEDAYSLHRKTRGEPNDNQQTWAVAPFEYDWPEAKATSTTRGVRIPQGRLAEIIRAFAKKNNVSVDKAAEMLADALSE